MDGYSYSNLTAPSSSPPPPATAATASGGGCRAARPSMELTNTKETKAWEGLAIGAVTLARTFSTGRSHSRFCRSGSERRKRSRSGLPGALRRTFSMRRHPAGGLGGAGDGYWRIHDDMDGDSDRSDGDGDGTVDEHGEDEAAAEEEEVENKKKMTTMEQRGHEDAAANAVAAECRKEKEKKLQRGGILKACKKLFRL